MGAVTGVPVVALVAVGAGYKPGFPDAVALIALIALIALGAAALGVVVWFLAALMTARRLPWLQADPAEHPAPVDGTT